MNKDNRTQNLPNVPVILCGGSGTRLWPLSRENYPKQFLPLVGEQSLFQQTLARLRYLEAKLEPGIIVGNESQRFLVLDELHQASYNAQIILEPVAKNTAPSLTLASLLAQDSYEEAVLIVMPADHSINDEVKFAEALDHAIHIIQQQPNSIVTLGITPHKPEVGFGYINAEKNTISDGELWHVKQFIEKPNLEKAQHYLEIGGYFWNAGIFVLRNSTWLALMSQCAEDIYYGIATSWQTKKFDNPFIRPNNVTFENIRADSIDYAVIEKCLNMGTSIYMIPLDAGWSDLGSWQAVSEQQAIDTNGNTITGDVFLESVSNSMIQANHRLVAAIGIQDIVIVETPDAILVVDKKYTQAVKKIVEQLKQQQREEVIHHRKVYRPWGWYDGIDEDERFKVKRICVKPKASLSLQRHHHRAEHWIVVKGTAEVQCGKDIKLLSENQSTYIPLGEVHRLSNPGNIDLELIEVQSGSYLEEDDIVRLDDHYGRMLNDSCSHHSSGDYY